MMLDYFHIHIKNFHFHLINYKNISEYDLFLKFSWLHFLHCLEPVVFANYSQLLSSTLALISFAEGRALEVDDPHGTKAIGIQVSSLPH